MVKWKERMENCVKNAAHYFEKDCDNDDNGNSGDSD